MYGGRVRRGALASPRRSSAVTVTVCHGDRNLVASSSRTVTVGYRLQRGKTTTSHLCLALTIVYLTLCVRLCTSSLLVIVAETGRLCLASGATFPCLGRHVVFKFGWAKKLMPYFDKGYQKTICHLSVIVIKQS